ncbi:MAG: trimeric intracellular cation channel family protein [Bacteroidales bacterium]|nr:trimeric intracellular cation channel family protein [Candidatus Cryptobacteroides equifaecalis]
MGTELVELNELVTIFDYLGTFAFAISGVRLAGAKNFDIFGAYVVGFVTAVGGGTIRDLCLGLTPFWMIQPSYVVITAIALLFVIVFKKHLIHMNNAFFIFDALGLGLFTVVGLEKSLAAGFPFWVNIIMAAITGAAGGMMRDVLINEVPLIFRKDIYAVASVLGGIIYYIAFSLGMADIGCQVLCLVSVVLIRILAVAFGVNLPSLRSEESART